MITRGDISAVTHNGNAAAGDIWKPQTAFVSGKKIDGTLDGECYQGFGQLLGSNTGGVTFTGYGPVRAIRFGDIYHIWGEVKITARSGAGGSDFQTGLKISNIVSALGLPGTPTYKGDFYNTLDVFDTGGNQFSGANSSKYGYGMVSEHYSGILNCARYYNTSGSMGGWPSNDASYTVGNLWVFSFEMDV